MLKNFSYTDGLFDLNTISPNGNYYYRIRKPVSINMSNFGAEIAFFTINGELIYHRKDTYAHWMEFNNKYEFVFWSSTGDEALFYEYSRNTTYDVIFLDFKSQTCLKFNRLKYENNISKYLFPNFNSEDVRAEAEKLNITLTNNLKDAVTESIFKKWLPR